MVVEPGEFFGYPVESVHGIAIDGTALGFSHNCLYLVTQFDYFFSGLVHNSVVFDLYKQKQVPCQTDYCYHILLSVTQSESPNETDLLVA